MHFYKRFSLFYKFKSKLNFFNILKTKLKFKLKFKTKFKKTKFKKFKTKRLNLLKFFNFLIDNRPRTTKFFKRKLNKLTFRHSYKNILRNRRFLRLTLSTQKIKSYRLNTFLLSLYKKNSAKNFSLRKSVGSVLMQSNFILNLIDAYYFISTKSLKINNRFVSSFFTKLSLGDVISFNNIIFLTNYFFYFKYTNKRYLNRKKRRNFKKFKKYIFFNKNLNKISLIIKKWLHLKNFFKVYYTNYEVDYRLGLIIIFKDYNPKTKITFVSNFFRPINIFNLWYYKF